MPFDYNLPTELFMKSQGFVPEDVPADSDTYESVTCILCQRVHLVNPRTGRVLGENDE
jgi:hypothetical protein